MVHDGGKYKGANVTPIRLGPLGHRDKFRSEVDGFDSIYFEQGFSEGRSCDFLCFSGSDVVTVGVGIGCVARGWRCEDGSAGKEFNGLGVWSVGCLDEHGSSLEHGGRVGLQIEVGRGVGAASVRTFVV